MRLTKILLGLLLVGLFVTTAHGQQLANGNLTAAQEAVTAQPGPRASVTMQIAGTWAATVTFEVSSDSVTYVSALATNVTSGASAATTTANGVFSVPNAGYQFVRARLSAYSSGTAVVTITAGMGTSATEVGAVTGTVTATQGTAAAANAGWPVRLCDTAGDCVNVLENNQTVPSGAVNMPVLPVLSTSASPTWQESVAVYISADLAGFTRTRGLTVDSDDASIAASQTNSNVNSLAMAYDGSVWRRVTFGTAGTASAQVTTIQGVASMTPVQVSSATDPCGSVAKTHIPINIVTATTTELTAALAGASNFYYICSIDLVTAGANNVALVDDDTDGCGSVTSGLAGGATAATGWNFAANGGLTKGNGTGTVFKTGGTNRVVCLMTSAAVQLSGSIGVVAAP